MICASTNLDSGAEGERAVSYQWNRDAGTRIVANMQSRSFRLSSVSSVLEIVLLNNNNKKLERMEMFSSMLNLQSKTLDALLAVA